MSDFNNWNRKIIDEFRANGEKVSGMFEGRTLLVLHAKGAKSRQERVNPVAYVRDEGRFVVIASKGSAPTNPDEISSLTICGSSPLERRTILYRANGLELDTH
jgi:hypothetical protein